jgi:hypothetical protein
MPNHGSGGALYADKVTTGGSSVQGRWNLATLERYQDIGLHSNNAANCAIKAMQSAAHYCCHLIDTT